MGRFYIGDFGLIFSWGGFVFLTINFIVGTSLSNTSLDEILLSFLFAFVLLAVTMVLPVYISVKYRLNFAQALKRFLPYKAVNIFFILIVVLINIGWYSIQLEVVKEVLKINNIFILILLSYLFCFGAYVYGHRWLKSFSFFAIVLFFAYVFWVIMQTNYNNLTMFNANSPVDFKDVYLTGMIIYGTWAFSSSSVIMDISRHGKSFFSSYVSLLIGMVLGNFVLIFLGYVYAKSMNISSFYEFVSIFGSGIGALLLVLNIWTTNDSNFYSSMVALNELGIKQIVSFGTIPLLSVTLVLMYGSDLFGLLSGWLVGMSYVGIVFTILWLYIVIESKRKKVVVK